MKCRPAQRARGFTLVELIVVLAIISLLASMAMPRFGNTLNHRRVEMAAQRVIADLKFARQRARITASSVRISFNKSADSYTLSGVTHPDFPAQVYRVSLAGEPYLVDISEVDAGGDTNLDFDAHGESDSAATITIRAATTTYEITLGRGGILPQASRTQ